LSQFINKAALDGYIEEKVAESVAAALAAPSNEDRWLTSDEAAEYLGLARWTVHDLVSEGKLPRHGGRKTKLMFRASELDAYVASRGRRD
jgi:excisionase family DNA binding protein